VFDPDGYVRTFIRRKDRGKRGLYVICGMV
jgi:hypothetical protein